MDLGYKRNFGVIIEEPRLTDFQVGSMTGIIPKILVPTSNWTPDLPAGEKQHSVYMDSMACVSFSAANVIKIQINFMIRTGLIPARVLNALKELGFIDENGKFDCSERWIAKVSGTTKQGNSLVKVWDAIREYGLLPQKDWNYPVDQRTPAFDWDDFYAEPPKELYEKARKTSKYGDLLDIKYEWLVAGGHVTVTMAKEWLKMAPFQVATAVCPPWEGEIIKACSRNVAHATTIYNVDDIYYDFDHYEPFKKRLAADYPIPYAMRGVVLFKDESAPEYDMNLTKRLAGRLLTNVDDRGALYYVDPVTLKRSKIGTKPEEIAEFLKNINEKKITTIGITNADISKIPII